MDRGIGPVAIVTARPVVYRIADTHVLAAARQVTDVPSTADLRSIARDLKRIFGRGSGSSAIVTETPFVYGVARMFGVFAERVSVNVRAFRCMEEARRRLSGDSAAGTPA